MKRWTMALALCLCLCLGAGALAEAGVLPQIDNSTARIPITDAIYAHFIAQGMTGPEPMCSKTHGAWLNLADGKADILFLIAPTESELAYFAEAGVDIEMKVFGYDGLVFLGNAANTVQSLTPAEIRAIYRGDIRWWRGFRNGADAEIEVYIRNPESGSQRLFESLVWNGYEMPDFQNMGFNESEVAAAQPVKREVVEEMSDMTYTIMQARYSIGYNIMSYVDNVFMGESATERSVITTGNVYLREEPSMNGKRVTSVPAGTVLPYLDETRVDERDVAWYNVRWEDEWLWVSSRFSEMDVDNTSLKLFEINGYAPTTENFANGNYPFVTTSYVAIRADEPADSPARRLYDWVGSDESRAIIEANSTLSVNFSDSVVLPARQSDPAAVAPLAADLARRDLSREELYGLTQGEAEALWLAVFAQSGMHFDQPGCAELFEGFGWYADLGRDYPRAMAVFNAHQRANEALIRGYMAELRRGLSNVQPRTLGYSQNETAMVGDDVTAAIQALTDLGLISPAAEATTYSKVVSDAVKYFQLNHGMEATGSMDALTRVLLLGPAW